MSNLRKNRHGTYYARIVVPPELRPIIGKNEFNESLGTKDPDAAKAKALPVLARMRRDIDDARHGTYQTHTDAAASAIVDWWWQSDVEGDDNTRHGAPLPYKSDLELQKALDEVIAAEGTAVDDTIRAAAFREAKRRLDEGFWESFQKPLEAASSPPAPVAAPMAPIAPASPYVPVQRDDDLMPDSARPISFHQPVFMATKAGRGRGTIASYEKTFERLITLLGDVPIRSVTTRQAEEFYQLLLRTPSDKRPDRMLDHDTIYRSISNLRQFFVWAVARHLISDNPMRKLIVDRPDDDDEDGKEPYSRDDIKVIAPALLTESAAKKWYGLAAMFSGMRLNEIAQLEFEDIIDLNGRKHFQITRISNHGHKKTTKTLSSRRQIPIHPELIRLGFLDWVAGRAKASKDGRIWPGYRYGRWWNETFTVELGVKSSAKTFHSWRHSFRDRLKVCGNLETVDRIMGHYRQGTGAKYGDRDLTPEETKAIDVVRYEIDLG